MAVRRACRACRACRATRSAARLKRHEQRRYQAACERRVLLLQRERKRKTNRGEEKEKGEDDVLATPSALSRRTYPPAEALSALKAPSSAMAVIDMAAFGRRRDSAVVRRTARSRRRKGKCHICSAFVSLSLISLSLSLSLSVARRADTATSLPAVSALGHGAGTPGATACDDLRPCRRLIVGRSFTVTPCLSPSLTLLSLPLRVARLPLPARVFLASRPVASEHRRGAQALLLLCRDASPFPSTLCSSFSPAFSGLLGRASRAGQRPLCSCARVPLLLSGRGRPSLSLL